jgi:hypothetical protein
MKPGFWSLRPTWHNFSSMIREAVAGCEAPTDMEKSHRQTASLYFGIAALEAFLNEERRSSQKDSKTAEETLKEIRRTRFKEKLSGSTTALPYAGQ